MDYYQRLEVVAQYETSRFSSAGGRIVDAVETKVMARLLQSHAGDNVLDLGSGTGRMARRLAANGVKIVMVDVSKPMLKQASKEVKAHSLDSRISLILADVNHLPFKRRLFKKAFSLRVVFHLKNTRQMFIEVNRVLENNGQFVFDTINRRSLRRFYLPISQRIVYHRLEDTTETQRQLTQTGFLVDSVVGRFFFPHTLYEKFPGSLVRLLKRIDERILKTQFGMNYACNLYWRAIKKKGHTNVPVVLVQRAS